MAISKFRDLTLISLSEEEQLVIACDSCGAVGLKEMDVVNVPPYVVGRFISRVPLMEVIASGATPITIVNTLAVEMEPTGKEIIRGVMDEVSLLGLDPRKLVTGSTEDNMPTLQTGLGITVIGKQQKSQSRLGRSRVGDKIFVVGLPKVGQEVMLEDESIVDLKVINNLIKFNQVREILPVGSKGIRYEAMELSRDANCHMQFFEHHQIDLTKPAGPATCVIISVAEDLRSTDNLFKLLGRPIYLIGELV